MERSYKGKKDGGKSGVVERERRCGEGSKVKGNGVKKIETSWEACLPEDRRSHWIYFFGARRRNPLQVAFSSRISKFLFVGWLIGWLVCPHTNSLKGKPKLILTSVGHH